MAPPSMRAIAWAKTQGWPDQTGRTWPGLRVTVGMAAGGRALGSVWRHHTRAFRAGRAPRSIWGSPRRPGPLSALQLLAYSFADAARVNRPIQVGVPCDARATSNSRSKRRIVL